MESFLGSWISTVHRNHYSDKGILGQNTQPFSDYPSSTVLYVLLGGEEERDRRDREKEGTSPLNISWLQLNKSPPSSHFLSISFHSAATFFPRGICFGLVPSKEEEEDAAKAFSPLLLLLLFLLVLLPSQNPLTTLGTSSEKGGRGRKMGGRERKSVFVCASMSDLILMMWSSAMVHLCCAPGCVVKFTDTVARSH